MNEYLLSVIGTVLLCSLLTALAPEGRTSIVIKGIARLVCVLAIIAPVLRFFKTGDLGEFNEENPDNFFSESVIEGEESFIQYYSELRVREAELALEKELSKQYALTADVALEWRLIKDEFGGYYAVDCIQIVRVRIDVSQEVSKEVKENVASYVTKNYCSEVLIE